MKYTFSQQIAGIKEARMLNECRMEGPLETIVTRAKELDGQLNDALSSIMSLQNDKYVAEDTRDKIISFAVWYSGMERPKVQAAYERYLKETK